MIDGRWRPDRNGFEMRGFADIVGGRVGDGRRDINGRWRLASNGFERAGRGVDRVQRGFVMCHGVRA